MKSETANIITEATADLESASRNLRSALKGSTALQGDSIGELIREAAELKRKCARLADLIEQDAK